MVVDNSFEGPVLTYKLSSSAEIRTVVSEGYNVSSSAVCGDKHQYCSLSSLSTSNGSSLVQVHLGGAIGVVLFDTNSFELIDEVVIDIDRMADLNCEFSTLLTPYGVKRGDILEFLAVCETQSSLYEVSYEVNVLNLEPSEPNIQSALFCSTDNRSRVLYFTSTAFPMGVIVFVAHRRVYFGQLGSTKTCRFIQQQVCSNVMRFEGVPVFRDDGSSEDEFQAIYCPEVTYLIDISRGEELIVGEFSPRGDSSPMFCSDEVYSILFGNQLSLRYVSNRSIVMPEMFFIFTGILQGDCRIMNNQYVSIFHLTDNTVVIANLNFSNYTMLGTSTFPPRVFSEAVLLGDSSQASVRNLRDAEFEDIIETSPLLGLVIDAGTIVACTTPEPSVSVPSPTSLSTSVSPAVIGISVAVGLLTLILLAILATIAAVFLFKR